MSDANAPAYPLHLAGDWGSETCYGLTKREAFAMAAMQGMCSNPSIIGPSARCGWDYVNCTPVGLAQAAMAQADALLSELSKPTDA